MNQLRILKTKTRRRSFLPKIINLLILLTTITLAGTSTPTTAQGLKKTIPNCIKVPDGRETCIECFRSRFVDNQCGTLQDDAHCTIYSLYALNKQKCIWCDPDYHLDPSNGSQCLPGSIKDCEFSLLQNNKLKCFVCNKGYPSQDFTQCVPFDGGGQSMNCLWGGRTQNGPFCARCRLEYTSFYGKCLQSVILGCMYAYSTQEHFCERCDGWYGYFFGGFERPCVFKGTFLEELRLKETHKE